MTDWLAAFLAGGMLLATGLTAEEYSAPGALCALSGAVILAACAHWAGIHFGFWPGVVQ
jgi:hypothetical protein